MYLRRSRWKCLCLFRYWKSVPFERGDVAAVRGLFERESRDCLDEYYQRELFFPGIAGESREEVLNNLCECVREKQGLPEDFYGSVIRREQISPTDYGGLVAIPHPDQVYSARTFAAVAVLQNRYGGHGMKYRL